MSLASDEDADVPSFLSCKKCTSSILKLRAFSLKQEEIEISEKGHRVQKIAKASQLTTLPFPGNSVTRRTLCRIYNANILPYSRLSVWMEEER